MQLCVLPAVETATRTRPMQPPSIAIARHSQSMRPAIDFGRVAIAIDEASIDYMRAPFSIDERGIDHKRGVIVVDESVLDDERDALFIERDALSIDEGVHRFWKPKFGHRARGGREMGRLGKIVPSPRDERGEGQGEGLWHSRQGSPSP